MRLIRFGEYKKEKPGVLDAAGRRRNCSAHIADFNAEFFGNAGFKTLGALEVESLPLVPEEAGWGAPVARPGKVSSDVSERKFRLHHGGQWVKGKSCDTFNPLGAWLSTPDEISAVNNLSLSLAVNGERRQCGNTRSMVFNVHYIVHYLSQFMTLEPGDLITTGTPPGVGFGMKPPTFLKRDDVMELTIDGLGKQRQICTLA